MLRLLGGPFALIDHNGQRRTDADFRDKLLLIYLGFTPCSDACPTDLQAIAGAIDQLERDCRVGAPQQKSPDLAGLQ